MTAQEFDQAIDRVTRSGALGRSSAYARLLRYLGNCSVAGNMPKELDIAVDVFDRSEGFDPSQDSLVRVYVHNLRQKLDVYYSEHPDSSEPRLEVPKGQYRLVLRQSEAANAESLPEKAATHVGYVVTIAALLGLAIGWVLSGTLTKDNGSQDFEAAPAWSSILDDDLPVTIVAGDYFMFAELDETGIPSRLIRDFRVNSSADLRRLRSVQPETTDLYGDIDLTYLPIGSGPALAELMQVLVDHDKVVNVIPASKFQIDSSRSSHVVYVGYLSALGQLAQFVFSGSGISIGNSYDELVVIDSGESYVSEAGMAADGETNYVDYGYVSIFPGPGQGSVLVVAGTRDEGLMQSARYLTSESGISDMMEALSGQSDDAPWFEVLLEVSGFDRSSLDSKRVYSGTVRADDIWTAR